jgi:hypothetical protein
VDFDGTEHFSDPIVVTNGVVAGVESNEQLEFALHQNFPNPFNPTTTIRFVTPSVGRISLKVYDMAGREIATLADDNLASGSHQRVFDGRALASGVYLYELIAGGRSERKKFVMMK